MAERRLRGGFGGLGRLLSNLSMPKVRPMQDMGTMGTTLFGGVVTQQERSSKWVGRTRYTTASDIAVNVSIVAAGIHHFLNLIAHPNWTVVPADPDNAQAVEAAEIVEEMMHDMITPWSRVVRRCGMYRFHGFSIHEWIAKKRKDGMIGMKDVEVRPQHTIERWDMDESGEILGAWQRSPHSAELLGLPRRKIIYLVEDTLTDSPEGIGIFRHLGEPYERLMLYLNLEARAYERDLRGIPIGRAPLAALKRAVDANAITQADATAMVKVIEDFVQTQIKKPTTGVVMDSVPYSSQSADGPKVSSVMQWGLELLTGPGQGFNEIAAAIDRTQREMARIIGVEHLMMGDQGGNRALAVDKSRNLYLIANSVNSYIAAVLDNDFIGPIADLNGWDEDIRPYFEVEDVTFKDVGEISTVLRDMAQAGAVLRPDDPIIDDVRSLMGLSPQPEMSNEELASAIGLAPEPKGGQLEAEGDDLQSELDKFLKGPGFNPYRDPKSGKFAPGPEGGGGGARGGGGADDHDLYLGTKETVAGQVLGAGITLKRGMKSHVIKPSQISGVVHVNKDGSIADLYDAAANEALRQFADFERFGEYAPKEQADTAAEVRNTWLGFGKAAYRDPDDKLIGVFTDQNDAYRYAVRVAKAHDTSALAFTVQVAEDDSLAEVFDTVFYVVIEVIEPEGIEKGPGFNPYRDPKSGKFAPGPSAGNAPRGDLSATVGPVVQPVDTIDSLYAKAAEGELAFKSDLESFAADTGGRAVFTPEGDGPGGSLKTRASAERKLRDELDGDASKLVDITRGTVEYDTVAGARIGAAEFINRNSDNILRVKDRIVNPANGYRDIAINFRTANGSVAEVQFITRTVAATKFGEGHVLYERMRTPGLSDREFLSLSSQSEQLYMSAYRADGNGDWR